MREVLDDLERWWRAGEAVGMATVVATWRSAPRPAGATMLVGADGTAVGSVSGGCVEGAVYELAASVVAAGAPVLQRYGVSDDDAFAVGLTCGGILDVYVEKIDPATFPEFGGVIEAIRSSTPVAVITCVAASKASVALAPGGPVIETDAPAAAAGDPAGRLGRRLVVYEDRVEGTLGGDRIDDAVADDARGMLANGRTGTLKYGYEGQRRGDELTLFVASYHAPPRMIVFGAIDFAAAVARIGAFLGYRVTVCDARPVFATKRRFPDAHEVIVAWPHRYLAAEADAGRLDNRTVVCVLTHDPKFDAPLLEVALRLPLAYIGAMGSRRTHDDRIKRLRDSGLTEAELARLASPVGLDLGARTPEETAVSVAAEIISAQWGGSGEHLSTMGGSIHHDT
ncbi:XdhC family protein [Rugosimonospora acidiphila]|uniref:XdhC family protein n=1 Tax=Rugosimonospora acidiphila TaxID=556531 RepID=A0ABP9ST24_9ACTN